MRRPILNRFTVAVADHLLLSVLWLVASLPLVTVPVATAALFDVTRQRQRGDEPPAVRAFLTACRQYVGPSLAAGLGWAALTAVLVADLVIVAEMDGPAASVLTLALFILIILYALFSVALFPVLVSYQGRLRDQLRVAGLTVVLAPVRGLLALAAVAGAAAAVWTLPLAILAVPSLVAATLLRLYRGAFDRLPGPSPAVTPYLAGHPDLTSLALSSPKETSR